MEVENDDKNINMPSLKIENKIKRKKQKMVQLKNVVGKSRKFDQELFDKFDPKARSIVKEKLGDLVCDNEDMYGEDLVFKCKELPYKYIEVQVYGSWDGEFPYKYPFVYSRKMRFSENTLFVSFNKNFTEAIIFSKKVISTIPKRLKKYDREFVNYVPWYKSVRLNVNDLTLNNIKLYAGIYVEE